MVVYCLNSHRPNQQIIIYFQVTPGTFVALFIVQENYKQ